MARHKASRKSKKDRDNKEVQQPEERPALPERSQELELEPSQLGDIFTPDRSGVSGVRDRRR